MKRRIFNFPRTDLLGYDPRHHPSYIKTIEIEVFRKNMMLHTFIASIFPLQA
jgi:hypothetical protein